MEIVLLELRALRLAELVLLPLSQLSPAQAMAQLQPAQVHSQQDRQQQSMLAQALERMALLPRVEQLPRSPSSLAKETMELPMASRELQQPNPVRPQSPLSLGLVVWLPLQQLLNAIALACVLLDLSPCPHHGPSPSNWDP
jgi:hypothetical protein